MDTSFSSLGSGVSSDDENQHSSDEEEGERTQEVGGVEDGYKDFHQNLSTNGKCKSTCLLSFWLG